MPELPEVETIVRRLSEVLPGKTIRKIEVFKEKSFQGDPKLLIGKKITKVGRRAKIIWLQITGEHDLIIHLKMTGQLILVDGEKKVGGGHPTKDWIRELPSKHTRVVFYFTDKSALYFNDLRIFGWLKVVDDVSLKEEFQKYGPDANLASVSLAYLQNAFAHRRLPIKLALMDNAVLAGVGNIYANEALYIAKVHPQHPANTLTDAEWKKVYQATKKVIRDGIRLGGTTFDGKYVDIRGLAGKYQKKLLVYGRKGKPCPTCKTPIEKIQLGGRGTFFCPQCQK